MAYFYDLVRQQHHEKQVLINYTFFHQGQAITLMKARVEADYTNTQLLEVRLYLQLQQPAQIQALEPWLQSAHIDTSAAINILHRGAQVGILEARLREDLLKASWSLTSHQLIRDWEQSKLPMALSDLACYVPLALRMTELA